ncbi:MAG: GNAT family N-acetyltransferase [Oscillospiraceae bacterium]|nr:GNAT family N-acetyltransferase [Oscillospiraceae bacterium]
MELVVKTYSELTKDELYDILYLRSDVFIMEQGRVCRDVDGDDRRALHVWLKDESGIAAYLRILCNEDTKTALIGRVIAVRRKTGLGKKIVTEALEISKEHFGAEKVLVHAQECAKGFYEKCGFKVISEPKFEDGSLHLWMEIDFRESFTPLEESVSFYTRNDFAIMNSLLVGDFDAVYGWAGVAYGDNQGILDEYANDVRTVSTDYDRKWINSLKKRLIGELDEDAKKLVVENAKSDLKNILTAMSPSGKELHLYRTAWINASRCPEGKFSYSREYLAIDLEEGETVDIKTVSSFSLTPYREEEDVGSEFYRYELTVPKGSPVLELDRFETHNEDGEVLLPPMKCMVESITGSNIKNCRGIIKLRFESELEVDTL